nr:alpha/beta hydrolase [Hyphomonas sp. Mor2]
MESFETGHTKSISIETGDLTFSALSLGEGPAVILIHGFPDGPRTFDAQLPALANAGYRAISVTTRGYERSSRPKNNNYGIVSLSGDVLRWLDALELDHAHLVGHDWGSPIAFGAAMMAPERIQSLTQIAVPNSLRLRVEMPKDFAQMWRSRYMFFFQLKGIAERRIAKSDAAYIEELWRRWSPGWTPNRDALDYIRTCFKDPEFLRASLSYYRQMSSVADEDKAMLETLNSQTLQTVPTLGVCGDLDQCVGADFFEKCMREEDYPNGLRVERVPNAGHFVQMEQPEAVNRILLEWLSEHANRLEN